MEFTRHENTNILPLRWFANWTEVVAHYYLQKCLRLDDKENYGFRYKVYSWVSNKLYKPALKWGTYYSTEFNEKDFDRTLLEHTDVTIRTHAKSRCEGEICTIHNRSNHSMRSFPQLWRSDRAIMERICEHGVGHPDPDEFRIIHGFDDSTHGCDGCCSGVETY